jgi:hypothetical protein
MATIVSSLFDNTARAISAYTDAARADSALLVSTALVGSDARVTDAGENYTGTVRWLNYTDPSTNYQQTQLITDKNINTIDASYQTEVYIKNVDHIAAQEMSIQRLISKVDGLSYLGAQFASIKARREDANLKSILQGIGDLTWTVTPTASDAAQTVGGTLKVGYYTGSTAANTYRPLFVNSSGAAAQRSVFFDLLFDALAAVAGDQELPFYYLVISAATYNILRKENVLDDGIVQDGNYTFNSILGGKIRLIVTGNTSSGLTGTRVAAVTNLKVSYVVKPGSILYADVMQLNPTEIWRDVLAGNGGGAVTIVSRWGNIMHPQGYSWAGSASAFPTNTNLATYSNWTLSAKNVNQTGIFPIFHG